MAQTSRTQTQNSADPLWWVNLDGSPAGPFDRDNIVGRIRNGQIGPQTLLCGVGDTEWRTLSQYSAFAPELNSPPPPPPIPARSIANGSKEDAESTLGGRVVRLFDRATQATMGRAISYWWEAIVCLLLYLPTLLLPLSGAMLFPIGCGYVLNTLLLSQAGRLESILQRPVPGAMMLRAMFYIASAILGTGTFVCIALSVFHAVRGN